MHHVHRTCFSELPALRCAAETLGIFPEMVGLPLIVERQFLEHTADVQNKGQWGRCSCVFTEVPAFAAYFTRNLFVAPLLTAHIGTGE